MNQNQVIETLKSEASTNPAFNAVCHVFALRERARHQVTVQALHYRMLKEGFNYPKPKYEEIIKILGSLGFGQVKYNKRAEVIGLYEVKSTLQSIGKAALGGDSKLKSYKQRHKFTDLPLQSKKVTTKPESVTTKSQPPGRVYPVSLTVMINKKPVNFRIPTNISESEIKDLVETFADRAMEGKAIDYPIAMTAVVKGTPVSLQVPKNITSQDIASLVVRFHDKGTA